jgi:hypothetical protein
MAREARLAEHTHPYKLWSASDDGLERFATLVATAEREECLAACRMYQDDDEPYPGFQNGVSCCIAAIENHEEFLEHMRKKGAP